VMEMADTNLENAPMEPDSNQASAVMCLEESPKDILSYPELDKVVNTRIMVLMKLEELSRERTVMIGNMDLPADARSELARQIREIRRFPTGEMACKNLHQMDAKIAAMKEAAMKGQAPAPSEAFLKTIDLAKRQWKLFVIRDELIPFLIEHAAKLSVREPLYQLLAQTSCSPQPMFGWANYTAAVEAVKRRVIPQRDVLRQRREQAPKNEVEQIQAALSKVEALISATIREINANEPAMMEVFWAAYQEGAALLTGGMVSKELQPCLRAFLRYGLIGTSPWLINPAVAKQLLDESAQYIEQLDESPKALHILYADEYIDLVARGIINPSIDEDLELNQRGSPAWLKDKNWRRIISGRIRYNTLTRLVTDLEVRVQHLTRENANLEGRLANCRRESKEREMLREKLQNHRIEMARRKIAIDYINNKLLPELDAKAKTAEAKLAETGGQADPGELARQETVRLHSVCRLCAKLKDPFPPFSLRDGFKNDCYNSRAVMLKEIRDLEICDPTIFQEILIQAKHPSQRTSARFSPYIVLGPCSGFMSFSWNPRTSVEVGRIVIPLYTQRAGILTSLLYSAFADFRWDTSKDSAGLDLLTSDTLVAAYCTVRWDFRKRAKEIRQKAGIYTQENDRKNWRRHYALYVGSAKEGGKNLFFKCVEIYNACVKYIGLPDGVKKLQR
jgi:hypothetical protein